MKAQEVVSVWKGINNSETHIVLQQWGGKKLVGINGIPLSGKGCVHTSVLIEGTEFEWSFVVSDGLMVDAIVGWTSLCHGLKNCSEFQLLTQQMHAVCWIGYSPTPEERDGACKDGDY